MVFELLIAGLDVFAGEGTEAVYAELFAAEASHDGAIDDGTPQFREIEFATIRGKAAAGEIADEAAGEAIARTGGVEDVVEKIAGDNEMIAAVE